MKKILSLLICLSAILFTSCDDTTFQMVKVMRSNWKRDNIYIEPPKDYVYSEHKKVRIDDDTVQVIIIYKNKGSKWEDVDERETNN